MNPIHELRLAGGARNQGGLSGLDYVADDPFASQVAARSRLGGFHRGARRLPSTLASVPPPVAWMPGLEQANSASGNAVEVDGAGGGTRSAVTS